MTPPDSDKTKPDSRENARINDLLIKAVARLEACGDNYARLSMVSFLVDQDKCFPEVLAFVERCNMDGITILISEVAESLVWLSSENHIATKFLQERGHRARLLLRPRR